LLDMCRTSVNVFGDLVACVVVDRATESTAKADAGPLAEAR
jgi:Na+/H+-dicarboxylate symporter